MPTSTVTSQASGWSVQRSATVPPRSAGGRSAKSVGEEDLEELGDAVGGDVGRDRLLAPVRRLAVPAVDRRLLGHPPPPEGGEVRADRPVPDRGVGLGGLQHAGERLGALLEPADKLWTRRQGDVGGRLALGFEVADSPGHGAVDAAGVLHQIGDGPGGARWHGGVKAQPGGLGEGGAVGEQRGDAAVLLHAGEYGRRGSWGQAGREFQAAVGRMRDAAGARGLHSDTRRRPIRGAIRRCAGLTGGRDDASDLRSHAAGGSPFRTRC